MNYDGLFKRAKGVLIEDVLNYYGISYSNNKICCLWHDDNHPSAYIYADSNVGYCFACSKGSFDGIDIVMLKENLEFKDAVAFLVNNFTVNKTYIARQKKSLELYFKLNDELRNLLKQGINIKLINKFGNMMDSFSDNEKILLRLYGGLLRQIKGVNNVGQGHENQ